VSGRGPGLFQSPSAEGATVNLPAPMIARRRRRRVTFAAEAGEASPVGHKPPGGLGIDFRAELQYTTKREGSPWCQGLRYGASGGFAGNATPGAN